jgi:aryl-alcohol dehydrogenase-like predicted oxidoreductase
VVLQHLLAMRPIPGTKSVGHLEDNVAAAEIRLGGDELRELECSA